MEELAGFFNFSKATSLGEWKLWVRTSFTPIKIDFMTHHVPSKEVKKILFR